MNRRAVLSGVAAGLVVLQGAISRPVRAQSGGLATPAGPVVLTISGKIRTTNAKGAAVFDRAMLEALGMETIETTTPWYPEKVKFEGVRLNKLMTLVGATGTAVTATALNDYSADLPLADFAAHGTLLALKRNGNYMAVREKGPLFIVYPFDTDPALRSERYYSRSVWQLKELVVK